MSRRTKRKKKSVGYDNDIPRCANCIHHKKPYVYLTTYSRTAQSPRLCKLHLFQISETGLCDYWKSWAGGGLEDGKDESMLNNEGERK